MSGKRPFDTHIILLMICMINIVNPNAVSGNLLVFYRHKCDCFLVCKCNHILVPDGIRADSLQHAIRNKSICLNGNASVCILSYLKCRIFQFQIFDWDKCLEFFLGNLLSVLHTHIRQQRIRCHHDLRSIPCILSQTGIPH